jgi:hypothetical protein
LIEPLTISRRSIANKVFGTIFVCAVLCGIIWVPTSGGQLALGICAAIIGILVAIDRSVTFDPLREEVVFAISLLGVATILRRVRQFGEFAAGIAMTGGGGRWSLWSAAAGWW